MEKFLPFPGPPPPVEKMYGESRYGAPSAPSRQYGDFSGSFDPQEAALAAAASITSQSESSVLGEIRSIANRIAQEVAENLATDPQFYQKAAGASVKHTCTLKCPQAGVGKVIGRRGEAIANVQAQTGCAVQVDQSTKEQGYSQLILTAPSEDALQRGMLQVEAMIESTKPIMLPEGVHYLPSGQEMHVVDIPENAVGGVIGSRGAMIQEITREFIITMFVDQSTPNGCNKKSAVIGPRESCLRAVQRIHDIISGRWGPDGPVIQTASTPTPAAAGGDVMAQWTAYWQQYYAAMGQTIPPEMLQQMAAQQFNQ